MATIETRKNKETGKDEIIIKDINNDLNGLIDIINKFRSKEKQNNPNSDKIEKIFITESLDFYEQTVDLEVNFSDCIFKKKVKLYNCTFLHRAYFDNTTFEDLVDFYGCTFKESQQFYKTDFNRVAIFSNATFEKEAQFIYCTTDISSSYISFQSAKFKKGLDIARANFNCKVSCWDIQVEDKGLNNAMQSKYYLLDFDFYWLKKEIRKHLPNDEIINMIDRENTSIETDINEIFSPQRVPENITNEIKKLTPVPKKLRESMRFIKNNFYAENNQIEGLEFYKKEMDIYQKEITSSKKDKNTLSLKEDTKQKCCISQIKNIFSWIENTKENHTMSYYLCIFILITLILSAYLYWKSYWAFWIFFVLYFCMIRLEIKLKNVKNAIKNSNYIPYVLLLFSTFLPLLPIYNHFDYKNNDKVYNLVMDIKQFFNTYNISSFIDSDWALIIIYPIGFIALLLAISFDFRDRILLFLNKISNNFGTNWMAGVNFTILIGLITLLPIIWLIDFNYNDILFFDPSPNGIGNFLYNLGQIINIAEWSDIKIYGTEITSWSYVWLFIGRIFIGYGYYQTIQAFRKYGKS